MVEFICGCSLFTVMFVLLYIAKCIGHTNSREVYCPKCKRKMQYLGNDRNDGNFTFGYCSPSLPYTEYWLCPDCCKTISIKL